MIEIVLSYGFGIRKQKAWPPLLQNFTEIHKLSDFVETLKLESSEAVSLRRRSVILCRLQHKANSLTFTIAQFYGNQRVF